MNTQDLLNKDLERTRELKLSLVEKISTNPSEKEKYQKLLENSVRVVKLCKKLNFLNFIKLAGAAENSQAVLKSIKQTLDDFAETRKLLDHIGAFNSKNQEAILAHVEEKGALDLYREIGVTTAEEAAEKMIEAQNKSKQGLRGLYTILGVRSDIGVILKVEKLLREQNKKTS